MRTYRFRIHSNQVEVEYEGSETFALERLLPAIERLTKAQLGVNTSSSPDSSAGTSSLEARPPQERPHPTTREIGDKIGAQDWDDLTLAACGYLTLARQLASYSQDQILEQMRLGPDCSESEMNRAFSRILKDMVKRGNLKWWRIRTEREETRIFGSAPNLERLERSVGLRSRFRKSKWELYDTLSGCFSSCFRTALSMRQIMHE